MTQATILALVAAKGRSGVVPPGLAQDDSTPLGEGVHPSRSSGELPVGEHPVQTYPESPQKPAPYLASVLLRYLT
jgi:hypothetical protein